MGFSTAMQAMKLARCQAMLHQCSPYFTCVKSIACTVAVESNSTRYIGASSDMQAMIFSMVMPGDDVPKLTAQNICAASQASSNVFSCEVSTHASYDLELSCEVSNISHVI